MKTPLDIIEKFEKASEGLEYGDAILTLSIKLGKPRYVIVREESLILSVEQPTQEKTD